MGQPGCVELLQSSLATNTWKKYGSAIKHWFSFCSTLRIDPLINHPPCILADFISHTFYSSKASLSSISTSIAAIKKLWTVHGHPITAFESELVQSVLKGARNLVAQTHKPSKHRLAMSLNALHIAGHVINKKTEWPAIDRHTFWCLLLTCFWGVFRVGDLVSTHARTISSKCLTWGCVKFEDNKVFIRTRTPKYSKDPRGEVRTLCPHEDKRICPVTWLQIIRTSHPNPDDPVFRYKSKVLITVAQVSNILKSVTELIKPPDNSGFSAHSLRAGIPSVMAARPDVFTRQEILHSGGWHSNAMDRYTRSSVAIAEATAVKLHKS